MLVELFIRNFAIIDEVRLSFGPGMTVLTGETGAGKSILVESIGLVIGGKASPSMIRTGEKEAIIEAVFSLNGHHQVMSLLSDWGIDSSDRLIVRRHIQTEGKNRIYLNGCAATLSQLSTMGAFLIDLASQHDSQILLDEERHIFLLDAFKKVSIATALDGYRPLYETFVKLTHEIGSLKKENTDRTERLEFLRYQLEEITKGEVNDPDEEQKLLDEKGRAKNADFLFTLASEGEQKLEAGSGSVVDLLDSLSSPLKKGIDVDQGLVGIFSLIETSRAASSEAARLFSRYREGLAVDPGRLEEIEKRLYQLHTLKKKYGSSLKEVIARREAIGKELHSLENYDDILVEREKELARVSQKTMAAALVLSDLRKKTARVVEGEIQKELAALSMPHSVFRVKLDSPANPDVDDLGPCGFDKVRLELSANPGQEPRPLVEVASGGELSRVMLAIKQVLRNASIPTTCIFDEVDAGIGGGVAEIVGKKLKSISRSSQVLCVTHLPQIASSADQHLLIEKKIKGDQTTVTVCHLEKHSEREEEIARMLGGIALTEKTKAHAKEMLKIGQIR